MSSSWFPAKLGSQKVYLMHGALYSNDDTGMTLTYFMAKSYLFPYAFVWEKDKNNMSVYNIKVGRCSLNQMSTWSIMNTLVWPWPILRQSHICSLMLLYGKKIKIIRLSIISKLVDAVNQMSTWSIMNIKGQGHSSKVTQVQHFQTFLINP